MHPSRPSRWRLLPPPGFCPRRSASRPTGPPAGHARRPVAPGVATGPGGAGRPRPRRPAQQADGQSRAPRRGRCAGRSPHGGNTRPHRHQAGRAAAGPPRPPPAPGAGCCGPIHARVAASRPGCAKSLLPGAGPRPHARHAGCRRGGTRRRPHGGPGRDQTWRDQAWRDQTLQAQTLSRAKNNCRSRKNHCQPSGACPKSKRT